MDENRYDEILNLLHQVRLLANNGCIVYRIRTLDPQILTERKMKNLIAEWRRLRPKNLAKFSTHQLEKRQIRLNRRGYENHVAELEEIHFELSFRRILNIF